MFTNLWWWNWQQDSFQILKSVFSFNNCKCDYLGESKSEPLFFRSWYTIYLFQVARAVTSNLKVFVLDGTWMDSYLIRDYFEARFNHTEVFSETELFMQIISYQAIHGLSTIWNILLLGVLLQANFRRRAINIYLSCLCSVFLLNSTMKLVLVSIHLGHPSTLETPYLCPILEVIFGAMQNLIAMLVTAVSIERYVAIDWYRCQNKPKGGYTQTFVWK